MVCAVIVVVHLRLPGVEGVEVCGVLHAEFGCAVGLVGVVHCEDLGPFGSVELRVVAVSGELEGRG